jgi:response regulator RpfG family c-di-GMP phosphodiesterase
VIAVAGAERGETAEGGRPRVLCVDDEPLVLEGLRDTLRRNFDVRVATSGPEGLEILRSEPNAFAVVISDMRMPRMPGADFLRMARLIAPDAVRMLLTGGADLEDAIRAVNGARLFRFLTKPCDSQELMRACAAALGQHRLQTAERVLLEQTLRGSVEALAEALSLSSPAAFGRAGRVKALAGKLARAEGVSNWWEVEVAATLGQIGAVALPATTAEKLYAGARLTAEEAAMVERVPVLTRRLLNKIPRLEGVLEILDRCREELGGDPALVEGGGAVPVGARVLRIAADYVELESDGTSGAVALGAMRNRGIYDPRLLDAFAGVIGVEEAAQVHEMSVSGLRVGMILADDVRGVTGNLLVVCGHDVTEQLIERLANLATGTVREPLRVYVPDGVR